eukprot:CAMPEP_0198208402 /NCGR_PEP_ID=MMETSP1445-20131203/11776_1 /TAXON_ID=36898 /ORGANISM="Pyramimonas sp., Strain CCMP2087" /LENGTH=509 /DNA_ID=CAMNT_0043881787 /DNA_START=584 /DNA_END=2113 /DNA_ORIENTATION=+
MSIDTSLMRIEDYVPERRVTNTCPFGEVSPRDGASGDGAQTFSKETALMGHLVVVMVGLPARGKSYIARKLNLYLTWIGVRVKVFNVGDHRRDSLGADSSRAEFFSVDNPAAADFRDKLAQEVQEVMYSWLAAQSGCAVSIFDATNTTKKRRQMVIERCKREPGVGLLFIESICQDPGILSQNYQIKLHNADYCNTDRQTALDDFRERVRNYERVYEELEDGEDNGDVQYIKLFNVGQKVCSYRCNGYLMSQISFYLQNIHITPRKIWLTHHAESEDLLMGKLGGTKRTLTPCGRTFTTRLAEFVKQRARELGEDPADVLVLTGTQAVHMETLKDCATVYPIVKASLLNELRGGDLEGLTDDEIRTLHPEEFRQRVQEKHLYRYPGAGGESYFDVMQRLRPIIIEVERQRRSLLVVCHLAVQQCIYGYFVGEKAEAIPYLPMKLHTVYELSTMLSDCQVVEHELCSVSPRVKFSSQRPPISHSAPTTPSKLSKVAASIRTNVPDVPRKP